MRTSFTNLPVESIHTFGEPTPALARLFPDFSPFPRSTLRITTANINAKTHMLKQACDACRRRKVRCNNAQPCSQCQSAGLACRSTLQRQKKGRQGRTANILNELRAKEGYHDTVENPAPLRSPAVTTDGLEQTPQSPKARNRGTFSRTPGLLTQELINACTGYFFSRMRGTVPVLDPVSFQREVDRANDCLHAYCLVSAFCAFVITQTGFSVDHTTRVGELGSSPEKIRLILLEEATEARSHIDPFTEPIGQNIIIAFLLYGCHIGLGNQRHAYYFLREATTLYTASALDGHVSTRADDDDSSLGTRLFWLLLVSER